MASNPFIQAHARRIAVLHRLKHLKNGEDASMVFEMLDGNRRQVESFTVSPFYYDTRSADDYALPSGVLYEMQISEALLTMDDLLFVSSLNHTTPFGVRCFNVVSGSVLLPIGTQRYWRFGLYLTETKAL